MPETQQEFVGLVHGGWGFGGARFIKQLLELPTIRESTFLFRVHHV